MPKRPELLYATNNPGKLDEVRQFLGGAMPIESPEDLKLEIEVEETGETLEENALLKARAFRAESPPDVIVMADDTGLEINALGGEPGVKTRRWRDGRTEMSDRAIIAYCLERLRYVSNGNRGARFRTVIALLLPDGEEHLFEGVLEGEILTEGPPPRRPGLPFGGLFHVPDAGKSLDDLEHESDPDFLTHRQKAVEKAVAWLRDYNK